MWELGGWEKRRGREELEARRIGSGRGGTQGSSGETGERGRGENLDLEVMV